MLVCELEVDDNQAANSNSGDSEEADLDDAEPAQEDGDVHEGAAEAEDEHEDDLQTVASRPSRPTRATGWNTQITKKIEKPQTLVWDRKVDI